MGADMQTPRRKISSEPLFHRAILISVAIDYYYCCCGIKLVFVDREWNQTDLRWIIKSNYVFHLLTVHIQYIDTYGFYVLLLLMTITLQYCFIAQP